MQYTHENFYYANNKAHFVSHVGVSTGNGTIWEAIKQNPKETVIAEVANIIKMWMALKIHYAFKFFSKGNVYLKEKEKKINCSGKQWILNQSQDAQ